MVILSLRYEEKLYFTDDSSVPLSCTAHCLRCILLRYHRWLQLTLAAWRKETNILFFIRLVKHFIREYKIITSLVKKVLVLKLVPVPSRVLIIWSRNCRPLHVVFLQWKTKRSRFHWWHLLVLGTHTKNIDLRKFLCLFLKTDTEELFLMWEGTVFQSVGAANVLKLKWGIERRFLDNERN